MGNKQENEEKQAKKLQKWASICGIWGPIVATIIGIAALLYDKNTTVINDDSTDVVTTIDVNKNSSVMTDVEIKDVDGSVIIIQDGDFNRSPSSEESESEKEQNEKEQNEKEQNEKEQIEIRRLLDLAESYYQQGDYVALAQVYSDQKLQGNPQALLNSVC